MCTDATSILTNNLRLITKFYMLNHHKSRVTPLKSVVLNKSQDAVDEARLMISSA